MIINEEYQKGDEVCFLKDGKKVKGNIKNFLTKIEAKYCNMWYIPLIIELKDNITVEIADYELI